MEDSVQLMDALDRRVERRNERREFFRTALGAAAVAGAGVAAVSLSGPATAQAITDADVLNFALNLEYLEAQFYSYAALGVGLNNNLLTGSGNQGAVSGGRRVTFTDPVVAQYAREIAQDEIAHVTFLRNALGTAAVSQPAIDISVSANSAFSKAAREARLITADQTFDPYASDENFLLGAFIFEDVGVSAYKGASPLITNNTYVDAAAGILAAEAFHAGIIRTQLYAKGIATPTLRTGSEAISTARDTLDGASDRDQGVAPQDVTVTLANGSSSTQTIANIAPTDSNGIAYSRTTSQVLSIVYLTGTAGATAGGFFPAGLNGNIRTTTANA
ncbi:ferritin-like domain-containing protein [Sphingomonas aracearum]|uniref:Ferritin-like domain-containing protein n=1 Tax=Sphingomonas aracearum TaxID=2283317 RepID=A0A369VY53_9SPHN|nr:ferritin-like domain-containing protein [Sphingomonas aracearum]RDE05992.1 ferritin-like domain-containing protein [Sphingomonas aracearum]